MSRPVAPSMRLKCYTCDKSNKHRHYSILLKVAMAVNTNRPTQQGEEGAATMVVVEGTSFDYAL